MGNISCIPKRIRIERVPIGVEALPSDFSDSIKRIEYFPNLANERFKLLGLQLHPGRTHTTICVSFPTGAICEAHWADSITTEPSKSDQLPELRGIAHLAEHLICAQRLKCLNGKNLLQWAGYCNGKANASTTDTEMRFWIYVPNSHTALAAEALYESIFHSRNFDEELVSCEVQLIDEEFECMRNTYEPTILRVIKAVAKYTSESDSIEIPTPDSIRSTPRGDSSNLQFDEGQDVESAAQQELQFTTSAGAEPIGKIRRASTIRRLLSFRCGEPPRAVTLKLQRNSYPLSETCGCSNTLSTKTHRNRTNLIQTVTRFLDDVVCKSVASLCIIGPNSPYQYASLIHHFARPTDTVRFPPEFIENNETTSAFRFVPEILLVRLNACKMEIRFLLPAKMANSEYVHVLSYISYLLMIGGKDSLSQRLSRHNIACRANGLTSHWGFGNCFYDIEFQIGEYAEASVAYLTWLSQSLYDALKAFLTDKLAELSTSAEAESSYIVYLKQKQVNYHAMRLSDHPSLAVKLASNLTKFGTYLHCSDTKTLLTRVLFNQSLVCGPRTLCSLMKEVLACLFDEKSHFCVATMPELTLDHLEGASVIVPITIDRVYQICYCAVGSVRSAQLRSESGNVGLLSQPSIDLALNKFGPIIGNSSELFHKASLDLRYRLSRSMELNIVQRNPFLPSGRDLELRSLSMGFKPLAHQNIPESIRYKKLSSDRGLHTYLYRKEDSETTHVFVTLRFWLINSLLFHSETAVILKDCGYAQRLMVARAAVAYLNYYVSQMLGGLANVASIEYSVELKAAIGGEPTAIELKMNGLSGEGTALMYSRILACMLKLRYEELPTVMKLMLRNAQKKMKQVAHSPDEQLRCATIEVVVPSMLSPERELSILTDLVQTDFASTILSKRSELTFSDLLEKSKIFLIVGGNISSEEVLGLYRQPLIELLQEMKVRLDETVGEAHLQDGYGDVIGPATTNYEITEESKTISHCIPPVLKLELWPSTGLLDTRNLMSEDMNEAQLRKLGFTVIINGESPKKQNVSLSRTQSVLIVPLINQTRGIAIRVNFNAFDTDKLYVIMLAKLLETEFAAYMRRSNTCGYYVSVTVSSFTSHHHIISLQVSSPANHRFPELFYSTFEFLHTPRTGMKHAVGPRQGPSPVSPIWSDKTEFNHFAEVFRRELEAQTNFSVGLDNEITRLVLSGAADPEVLIESAKNLTFESFIALAHDIIWTRPQVCFYSIDRAALANFGILNKSLARESQGDRIWLVGESVSQAQKLIAVKRHKLT